MQRLLPSWLRGYRRGWWRFDIIGGLTVTAILIPEGMAYAQLAGVDPEAAFYAAPAALILYALLGSSRQLVVAVSSAVAITSAATISALAPQGTSEYVTLTAALAALAGMVSVAAGLLRLGRIARLFSSSVLLGFVAGLALVITLKQLPKVLGVELPSAGFFVTVGELIKALPDTSVVTAVVGLACIAGMVGLQRFMPKLPAALIVLVVSISVSALLDLSAHGVEVVGPLPSGLAPPRLPGAGWDALPLLATGAVGIALLAFAEAMGPAQQLARKHGYQIDANRELVAIGASNIGAGLFQGFPIGASLSKSAANDRAGARSPMSLIVAAAATVLVALFLTPLFQDLPEAALAAIVIVAVADMERIAPFRRLWRIRRVDFLLAVTALLGVLVLGILPGLGLAVGISLAVIVWQAGAGRVRLAGRPEVIQGAAAPDADSHQPGERSDRTADGPDPRAERPEQQPGGAAGPPGHIHAQRDAGDGAAARSAPTRSPVAGLLVAHPQQMLFFVNAAEIRDRVQTAVTTSSTRPDVVVVDLSLTPDLDVPALDMLIDLRDTLGGDTIELWLTSNVDLVRERLMMAGVTGSGQVRVYRDVTAAVLAYLSRHAHDGGAPRRAVLEDLVTFLRLRKQDVALDEPERMLLREVEDRIRAELDGY